jgi:SAM-dependent methyltransferase
MDAERLRIAFDPATLDLYGRHLARLEHVVGRRGRLLDLGCGCGAFLTVARNAAWNVEAVEIGRASAAYARDRLGLTVHRVPLEEAEFPAGAFDAVVMLEVIEHLESPSAALARVARWLRPGGAALISTPNFDSLYRRLHGAGWWVVNLEEEHIMLFTEASLTRLLRSRGFEVAWRQIRSIDLAGILGSFVPRSRPTEPPSAPEPTEGGEGYHRARAGKEAVKAALGRVGLVGVARVLARQLDAAFSFPWSPLHAWGEQLVVIARRTAS